jgi:glutamate synthase (NADPH/NADH) large chain
VEGVGDHACEYMTGGTVLVLGPVGRNFAAGMTGGVAYVLAPDARFATRCHPETVVVEPVEPADRLIIAELLAAHRRATGSRIARRLLRTGEPALRAFRKIAPGRKAVPAAAPAKAAI